MNKLILIYENEIASRLDQFIALNKEACSRTEAQRIIEQGLVYINDVVATKSSRLIFKGDTITINEGSPAGRAPSIKGFEDFFKKNLIYEHAHFLIINKPAGLLTHPASHKGKEVALSDIVVASYPEIAQVGENTRPGIVHRLDKYTSGLIVVARTPHGYETLRTLFSTRAMKKIYYALVQGHVEKKGIIKTSIMRDMVDPCKMTCCFTTEGRPSETEFEAVIYFKAGLNPLPYTLIRVFPKTGRTHQIRVHMASIEHPLIGDTLYGNKKTGDLGRYALHAAELSFTFDGTEFSFKAEMPDDLAAFLKTCHPVDKL